MRNGEPVPLTPKAFATLVVLVQRSGHLVQKDELMKLLWPDSFVEESNLNQHVWTLRQTLGENKAGNEYIETVPKRGYRFAFTSVNRDTAGIYRSRSGIESTREVKLCRAIWCGVAYGFREFYSGA